MGTIAYSIRRSAKARRVRVRIEPDGNVEVVLPQRAAEREAARAMRELDGWVRARLAEVERARAVVRGRGDTVPYLGEVLVLRREPGRSRVHRRGESLLVPDGDHGEALERWYRRQAREEIEPLVRQAAAHLGVHAAGVTIRAQRTRWGGCSATGRLSFNWRLLMAPREVMESVVWHEVCHLAVHDHSRRFWALLDRHCPDHRAHSAWLDRNGATLAL